MGELHEECGVVAVYHFLNGKVSKLCPPQGPQEATRLLLRMLLDVQNRGQLSAGITAFNPQRKHPLKTYKDVGTVAEAFCQSHHDQFAKIMTSLLGVAGIGHVRYATCGKDDVNYAHPFERPHIKKNKWFSFAFNGQLANYEALKNELLEQDENACFALDADSEIFMHYLCAALKDSERDLLKICQKTTSRLDGAYSLVFLNALGEMFVCRDPHGVKPLCYACDGALFAAASESVALFNLGFTNDQIMDVPPGGCVIVKPDGTVRLEQFAASPRTASCFFEWIYFANAASIIDGKSVYLSRKRLGEELARREDVPIDSSTIVVPVPDTSRAAADGMAYALHVPCLEGLMRNRYSGRTFIEGGDTRERKAQTKYTPLPQVLEGKRVLLVEDSIVRSTTMRVLIKRIYEIGRAKEIHVRVACPPIVAPCFYGIDMSTYSELFATKFLVDHYGFDGVKSSDDLSAKWTMTPEIEAEMAKELGCDSLRYLRPKAISKAIGIESLNLCQACVNHEYPTEWGCNLSEIARRNFIDGNSGRTYE